MNAASARMAAGIGHWALDYTGSSRSSALIRIGVVLLLWARFGGDLVLHRDPGAAGIALSLNFYCATLLMLVGYHTRLATLWTGAVVFTMYFWFGLHTGARPWVQHHTYLLGILAVLSAITPAGRSYSVDRWLAVKRSLATEQAPPAESGNLMGLRLIALQLCVMYFFTALDKTDPVWLSGERLQFIVVWYYTAPSFPDPAWFVPLTISCAWVVLLLEYALAFGLFVPRLQRPLMVAGIALHLAFYALLTVKTFSLTCILMYLAVLPARDVHACTDL